MSTEPTPTLSVCMIVRDEEENLPRCLASVMGFADELIVVDTGSTDSTVAVAEQYGATVLHHPWDGSFSTARNVSLDAAHGDWLLVLDADEALVDGSRIKAILAETEPFVEGFVLPMVNFVGDRDHEDAVTSPAARLFRNRPEYRYSRALHEQILATIQSTREGAVVRWLDVPVEHWGYLTAVVADREKVARNIALAEEEVRRYPDDAFAWYNLGQEHFRMCRFEEAIAAYKHGFPYLEGLTCGFAPALVKHLIVSLLGLNRAHEALAVLEDALEVYGGFTDLWVLQGHALAQLERWSEAAAAYRIALEKGEVVSGIFMSDEGVGSFKSLWWLSVSLRNMGERAEATECALRSLDVLRERRRYLPGGIELLLQFAHETGQPVREAIDQIGERLDLTDSRWREMLACRLISRGWRAEGEELLASAETLEPNTLAMLGSARLAAGDAEGAVAVFARLPEQCDQRATTVLDRVTAHALCGDAVSAEAALTGAGSAVTPAFAELYRGLTRLWRGDATVLVNAAVLSDGDMPAMRERLTATLRVALVAGDPDLVTRSLPALGWLGWEDHEQARLLGQLYHHAGMSEAATQALSLAVQVGDKSPETWQLLGLLLLKRQSYELAEEILGQALALLVDAGVDPSRSVARQGWLASLAAQGRSDEAENLWKQWKRTTPDPSPTRLVTIA